MPEPIVIRPGGIDVNLSPDAFHRWARHYYKCRQDFKSPDPGFSPVPHFLLCRAIELELNARHLMGARQASVKRNFGHNLLKAYQCLAPDQHVLTKEELKTLRIGTKKYLSTDLAYFNPEDALRAFKSFPNFEQLDEIARKLIEKSPI